jgi:hypothetical protein
MELTKAQQKTIVEAVILLHEAGTVRWGDGVQGEFRDGVKIGEGATAYLPTMRLLQNPLDILIFKTDDGWEQVAVPESLAEKFNALFVEAATK